MAQRRLDPVVVGTAVEAVLDGVGVKTAAKMFPSVSASSIRNAVRASGKPRRREPRTGRPPKDPLLVQAAVEKVRRGMRVVDAAAAAGVAVSTLRRALQGQVVGMQPHKPRPDELTLEEREEIRLGVAAGETDTDIARRIGRHRGTIGREIQRNGGRDAYRACHAQERAGTVARRPKRRWFEQRPWLWDQVKEALQEATWSPQSIAARLRQEHPDKPECRVSHEAIYQAIYVQARGELRKELLSCLRSGRVRRKPQGRAHRGESKIVGLVSISERPAEAADRAVAGHWEGDLIVGADSRSYVATLVERTSRYGLLIKLESKNAEHVAVRLAEHIQTLPTHVLRSLTWDRGTELAGHARFTVASGVSVYFADPHSPWQRPSNENWNGLARYFLPKGTDLSIHSQEDLDIYARKINGRPREIHGWKTAAEVFNELVALTS